MTTSQLSDSFDVPLDRIRLRRGCPVNLSVGRIILTGLLYRAADGLYSQNVYGGAQLLTVHPNTTIPTIHDLRIGETFDLTRRWILHTVLDHDGGQATAIICPHRGRARSQP